MWWGFFLFIKALCFLQDWKEENDHTGSAGRSAESHERRHQLGLLLPDAVHQSKPETGSHRVPQEGSPQPDVRHREDLHDCRRRRHGATTTTQSEKKALDLNICSLIFLNYVLICMSCEIDIFRLTLFFSHLSNVLELLRVSNKKSTRLVIMKTFIFLYTLAEMVNIKMIMKAA